MLEHPAFIQWHLEKDAASIWRLRELLPLMKLSVFELHHVDQCDFGMPARANRLSSLLGGLHRTSVFLFVNFVLQQILDKYAPSRATIWMDH